MGIIIDLDPVLVRLGSLAVSWHGLFTALALLVGLWLAARLARARGVRADHIGRVACWGMLGGLVGARLLHVIDAWETYAADPFRILVVNEGGIAIYGAILGGSAAVALYARFSGLPVGKLADVGGLGLLLGQAVGRLGDLINGEHWALPTALPWGVRYTHPDTAGQAEFVHPVAGYEVLWDLLVLGGLLRWGQRLPAAGMIYWVYLGLYGVGRFFLSFLRLDRIWLWELRQAQIVAMVTVVVAVVMLVKLAGPGTVMASDGPRRRGRARTRPPAALAQATRRSQRKRTGSSDGLELLTAAGAGFLAYFGAEVLLAAQPHPLHWVAAIVVGLLGYSGGRLWLAWQQR